MPQFTVIAGPNGAGKSTFSGLMSRPGALIFDPDKEKHAIEKSFPDISDEALESAVTRKYYDFELQAMGSQRHLTVETNLRNEFVAERAKFFGENGYDTRLVFMLLPDLVSSMDRVNLRVKQKGHFVDSESIRFNFETSLLNLRKVALNFGHVMLVSNIGKPGIISGPELLITVENGKLTQLNENAPQWSIPIVKDILDILIPQDRGNQLNR